MKKVALISFILSTGLLIYLSILNNQKEYHYKIVHFKEETSSNQRFAIKKEKEMIDVYSFDECNTKEHHGNCLKCNN
jgi:hypothetical protein